VAGRAALHRPDPTVSTRAGSSERHAMRGEQ
jgi:hypothetical protein